MSLTSNEAEKVAKKLREVPVSSQIDLKITGTSIIVGDMTRLSGKDSAEAEKKILPWVIILLVLVFGALVSALLPILIGFMSIIITLGALFVVGNFFELTLFCKAITSMMGLGVGIDYSLFMVSRFREELQSGKTPAQGAIETTATAGKAVCYSGFAVSIGMAALLIPDLPLTRSIGFSGMFVVIISILLSLTLLPIVFSYLGENINAPRFLNRLVSLSASTQNFWLKWSKMVMKNPISFFSGGLIILLFISYFTFNMKLWNSSVLLMPEELESREGFANILQIDPSRKYSPIGISFETKDGSNIYKAENLREIYNFTKKILDFPEVDRIAGLVDPSTGTSLEAYQNLYSNTLLLESMGMVQSNPFVATDRTKSLVWAFHKNSDIETADWDTVISMRKFRDNNEPTNLKVMIGGGGSTNVDFKNAVYEYFPTIIILIVIATYIIMFSLLGSVILPFKAIFMNLLSVSASYGWLVLVFQYGVTAKFLNLSQIPGVCIIFGLSMDYEIFMMSRIKEEYDKTEDVEYSVSMGLERSGGIITSAALIMIIVFSAFSFSKVILVQEIGLGLATAVFIDATIIRIMMVPSVMKLLDKNAWWLPRRWRNKLTLVKLEH